MKKFTYLLLLLLICSSFSYGQTRKSVSILGDSYSTFEGFIPQNYFTWYPREGASVNSAKQTWWHKFIKENGYHLCENESFSGSTICNTGYEGKDYTSTSFVTRMNRLGCPDIIFIFGGTNDSWANVPLGEYQYEGWKKEDLFKFRPAMTYMLDHMIDYYPNVDIYFILNSELKDETNESVRTICKHYNVGCIELHDIEKEIGHPSVKGMEQITDQINTFIKKNKKKKK